MKTWGISGYVIGFMITVTAVTWALEAHAGVYPTNTCVSGKMAAAAAYCQSALKAWSTWDKNQNNTKRDAALSKAATTLGNNWQKAEATATKNGVDCAQTTLSSSALQSVVDTSVTEVVTNINDGLDLGNKYNANCGSKLLNAAAAKCNGLLKADAKYIKNVNTDTTGAVRDADKTKASRAFAATWFKATALACPTTATKSAIEGLVDDLDNQVVMDTTVSPNVDNTQFTPITPTNPTTYLGRQYTPECMDESTYSFFVKRGSVNKLVMYYQGGGACWEQLTCGLPTCDTTVDSSTDPSDHSSDNPSNPNNQIGFGDLSNPLNPFKDWNIVFVAYCSCDIHYGDAVQDYDDINSDSPLHVVHHGFHNAKVAEKWAREHFVNPEMVFVTGSSAGAYGAVFNAPLLEKVWPASQFRVLGDAGNGVITSDFLKEYFSNWNFTANLPPYIPGVVESITSGSGMVAYTEAVASYFPNTLWAHYATAFDGGTGGQTGFYNIMLSFTNDNNDPTSINVLDWLTWWNASCAFNTNMVDQATTTAADVALENGNYRYYIGSGSRHTMWGSDKVYTDTTGGVPLIVDWINAMLIGSPDWVNVEANPSNVLLPGDPQPSPLEPPFAQSGANVVVNCP
jgi:hypothetical protein